MHGCGPGAATHAAAPGFFLAAAGPQGSLAGGGAGCRAGRGDGCGRPGTGPAAEEKKRNERKAQRDANVKAKGRG